MKTNDDKQTREPNQTSLSRKFRIAREAFDITQVEFEEAKAYTQSGVSALETGRFVKAPPEYLSFLAERGVNLSALFNQKVDEKAFKDICEGRTPTAIPAPSGPCQKCEEKDHVIESLERTVRDRGKMISMLEAQTVLPVMEKKLG